MVVREPIPCRYCDVMMAVPFGEGEERFEGRCATCNAEQVWYRPVEGRPCLVDRDLVEA